MRTTLGPVSRALEAELRAHVFRHGLVYWLDRDDHYSGFVRQLTELRGARELPYDVLSYQHSHLELMMALEGHVGAIDPPRLVIHLPAFNEERVSQSPLLELCAAGKRFRKKLETLVTEAAAGQVRHEAAAEFSRKADLTLEEADAWLTAELQGDKGELAGRLRSMSLPALMDALLASGELAQRLAWGPNQEAAWERVETAAGMPQAWREAYVSPGSTSALDIAEALAGWAMCVEYVHDLLRPPVAQQLTPAKKLPRKTVEACLDLVVHLRSAHKTFYANTATETQSLLAEEVEVARAEDLGRIDTFRFEDDRVLEAAMAALHDGNHEEALTWAELRIDGGSFWLSHAPSRRSEWELVRDAARLDQALEAAGPELKAGSLDQAVKRYLKVGAEVDSRHRHLEQQRAALLYSQLSEYEVLRPRLDESRQRWRTWADAWARGFSDLCKKEGFLPAVELQQRELFDQVVRPLASEPGTTAVLLVDALRYEMATELYEAMEGTPATSVHLDARLAELPTVTAMGMNALAPVSDGGALHLEMSDQGIKGISTGEYRVFNAETRRRAMANRVGGDTCPLLSLDEVLDRDLTRLKQNVTRSRLMVVHSTEIDDAGEKGEGPAVFHKALQRIRAGLRRLREAGVRRFVVTADHGFLLLDASTERTQPRGRKIDPHRRHLFSPHATEQDNEVRVPLSDLRYEGADGHLIFPESTAVFDTGRRKKSFVHGGNSLQERVIPVLSVAHRVPAGGSTHCYRVDADAAEGVAGMHCLSAKVTPVGQTNLAFGGLKELELGLTVLDAEDVQVELCQARGAARLVGATVVSEVGRSFELFFRLLGRQDARVHVELTHSGAQAEVISGTVEQRFPVSPDGRRPAPAAPSSGASDRSWLDKLPAGGVRELFEHLAVHGAVTDPEAARILGSPRKVRRFSHHFEVFAAAAPFDVQIQMVGGVKRYVRQGSDS